MKLRIFFLLAVISVVEIQGNNLTEQELIDYDPPERIQKMFPYYLSGYDEDGAPIWIWEFGKWDIKSMVEAGGEELEEIHRSADHMFLLFRESGRAAPDRQGFVTIMDLDGYPLSQAASLPTVTFVIGKFRKFEELIKDGDMKIGWIINANFLFERVWQIGKPLLGVLANSVEVFGTNPEKWKYKLLKTIPKDQLPEWYGGVKDFVPVKVYG